MGKEIVYFELNNWSSRRRILVEADQTRKEGKMDKEKFYTYILDNFTLSAETQRIISNILTYVELNAANSDDAHKLLGFFLDGTIGITDEEIRMFTIE